MFSAFIALGWVTKKAGAPLQTAPTMQQVL
jgi:hypothetical protein